MTSTELPRESQDPSPSEPYRARLSTSVGHPIHPTTSTSTPAQNTVDGSTLTTCAHCSSTRRIDTWCSSPACAERVARLQAEEDQRRHATDVRPVMPVVARALDLDELDELDRFAAAGDWLPPGDGQALVAEVRRLQAERDTLLDRLSDRTAAKWAAEDERDQLRVELAADRKAIGVFGAAIGKVSELHVDNGRGYCRACHVVAPCATAQAIGAGQ